MQRHAGIVERIEGSVGHVELNRPERANAYNEAMLDALANALESFETSTEIRVIVFSSAAPGRFCSGADLEELGQREAADALDLKSLRVFDAIAACPKPTLAAIDGPAVAGGLELALACDLRIATDRSRFAMPETSLGLIPAAGGTFRLPRTVGEAVARQMILFGAELDAGKALACGLVTEVVTPGDLGGRVDQWAANAAKSDPLALRLAKQALAMATADRGARELTSAAQAALYERRRRRQSEDPR